MGSFATEREQVPTETADERAGQRIEGADERPVVESALPSMMEPRSHRESLRHDADVLEPGQEPSELAAAELEKDRCIIVLEADFHELRQRIEPRNPVVYLKDRVAAGFQYPAAFTNQLYGIRGVLDDPMRVDQIEGAVRKWQMLAVADEELASERLLFEIRLREADRGRGQVDTRHACASPGEPGQVHGRTAPDLEDRAAAVAFEVHEPEQVVELLEVVLIEVVEKSARADRVPRDFEIVYVPFPVLADCVSRGHAGHYIMATHNGRRTVNS